MMENSLSPIPLNDKSILVTGGASGLGAALCAQLSASGARIMLADLQEENAQRTATALLEKGRRVDVVICDVGDPDQAEHAVRETIEKLGGIDVLINNAGTDISGSLNEIETAQWERVLRTNLHGPFLMARAAARYMMGQGSGHIVNIASTAAKRAWPNACAYHASKSGLLGLSHALHAELRPAGIKVTAVILGGMATPLMLKRFPQVDQSCLQDPANVALAICQLLQLPVESVVPEITILPMRETSWP
jgi:NAD(P)-dependent dehydrogenase (short-subunit alcohol dehydrogenase family)